MLATPLFTAVHSSVGDCGDLEQDALRNAKPTLIEANALTTTQRR